MTPFEQLDKSQQESIEAEAEFQSEGRVISDKYHEVMELSEKVEKRNRAIIEGNLTEYYALTEEMFGDQ